MQDKNKSACTFKQLKHKPAIKNCKQTNNKTNLSSPEMGLHKNVNLCALLPHNSGKSSTSTCDVS